MYTVFVALATHTLIVASSTALWQAEWKQSSFGRSSNSLAWSRAELELQDALSHTREFPWRVPHDLSNATTRRPTCIFVISISITLYTYPDKLRRSIINHLLCLFCLFCCILYRTSLFTIFIHRIQITTVWLLTPQCMVLCVCCMLAPHSNWVESSLLLCVIVIHLGCIVP